jgi:DNA-binding NarL/FixJ family response regulator
MRPSLLALKQRHSIFLSVFWDGSIYMSNTLTTKEERITALVAEGLKNNEIAKFVGTTTNMVKNYLKTIFDKTGTWTRLELALWYLKTNES